MVHTMALDNIDLYLAPFYGSAAPFPEMDLNGNGEFDFTDLNAASSYYPVVRDYYYSPFGEIWKGEIECDTNPFRYAGEYYDKETGNIYLRARYYSPSTGRFLSIDPIKDGTNWYVYCGNNPIKFVDPSGLYYLKDNKDGTYSVVKPTAADDLARIASSISFFGSEFMVAYESYHGYVGGSSYTEKGTEIMNELTKKSLTHTLSEAGQATLKKLGTYKTCLDVLISVSLNHETKSLDKIYFNLMTEANISTTSTSLSVVQNRINKTENFVGFFDFYFNTQIPYTQYEKFSLYEIDRAIINSKNPKKKMREYTLNYWTALRNSKNAPLDVDGVAKAYWSILSNAEDRYDSMMNLYKEYMGE